MRQGELIRLRWQDVDLDTGRLRVTRALNRASDGQTFKEPKTERSRRTLDMPASVAAALQVHSDQQQFARQAAGRRWRESGLDPANLLKAFKHHLKDAGLPDMRFHDLRHSAASMTLANGLPLNVVSDLVGPAPSLRSCTLSAWTHRAERRR